jgi:hypothetical protein
MASRSSICDSWHDFRGDTARLPESGPGDVTYLRTDPVCSSEIASVRRRRSARRAA